MFTPLVSFYFRATSRALCYLLLSLVHARSRYSFLSPPRYFVGCLSFGLWLLLCSPASPPDSSSPSVPCSRHPMVRLVRGPQKQKNSRCSDPFLRLVCSFFLFAAAAIVAAACDPASIFAVAHPVSFSRSIVPAILFYFHCLTCFRFAVAPQTRKARKV